MTTIYFEVFRYLGNGKRQFEFRSGSYEECEQYISRTAPVDRYGYPMASLYEIHLEYGA